MGDLINATDTALTNPFAAFAQEQASANTLKGDLLKFQKGVWTRGQNDTVVKAGTTFTVDMNEILVGWQRWRDRKVTAANLGSIASGFRPPQRHTLGDEDKAQWETDNNGKPQDPWQLTTVVYMQDDDGDDVTFSTASYGGRNAVTDLCKQYATEMGSHVGDNPIVEIGADSYKHKEYGLTHVPTLKIIGWEGGDAPAVIDKPVPAKSSKAKF
jgi:hypothetical protein